MKTILALLISATLSFAAIPGTTLWEVEAAATAGNVNGGGFDPAATGMLTDLACTSATGNAPVCTSASYNFVAGDANAWLYIQSGANWTAGFYKISSVGANAATVDATVGHAVQLSATQLRYAPSTVAGIATTASPTAGTFTVDYSQQAAAKLALSDTASVGSSTTLTSATAGFTPVMVGNFIHITTTGTGAHCTIGWYEITVYTSATTVTTDRTTNDGTGCVAGTSKVGGAISLNGSTVNLTDDSFFKALTAGNTMYIQSGSYTLAVQVITANAGGTQNPTLMLGYTTYRGDATNASSRPLLSGTFIMNMSANWEFYNLAVTLGGATGLTLGTGGKIVNSKIINSSTTASRPAITLGAGNWLRGVEAISYRGPALTQGNATSVILEGSYLHGSDAGILNNGTSGGVNCVDSIIEDNASYAINFSVSSNTARSSLLNCTLYGAENKLGVGVNMATGFTDLRIMNSILYGFTTAVVGVDANSVGVDNYNDYFNNTANVSAATQWQLGTTDLFVNPTFASVGQYTGTTATSSTNVLTDSGANFANVVDNQDLVLIVSGTGTGIPASTHFLITSHTATTLTLSSNITSSGSGTGITYSVTYGHNFAIGNASLKSGGYPGLFPGGLTTGYLPIGAVASFPGSGGSYGIVQ